MSLFSAFAKDLFEFANVTGKIVGNVAHGKLDSLGSPAGRGAEVDFGVEGYFGDEDLESAALNSEASRDVLVEILQQRSTYIEPISAEESGNDGEEFVTWRKRYESLIFTTDRSRLNNLLNQNATVRQFYDELCLEAISKGQAQELQEEGEATPQVAEAGIHRMPEREFFTRYFYRIYRGRCESAAENRRRAQEAAALEEKSKKQGPTTASSTHAAAEDDDPWGDFDAAQGSDGKKSTTTATAGGSSQLQVRDLNRRLEKTVESLTDQVQRLTAENKQLRERIAFLEAAAAAGAGTGTGATVATAGSTQSMPSSSSSSSAVVVHSADSPTSKSEPQKASQDDDYADWADTA